MIAHDLNLRSLTLLTFNRKRIALRGQPRSVLGEGSFCGWMVP